MTARKAIKILSENLNRFARSHSLRVRTHLHMSSWNDLVFDNSCFDIVCGNPPYVSPLEWRTDVDHSVKDFEPQVALTTEEPTAHQNRLAEIFGVSSEELERQALGPFFENLMAASQWLSPGSLMGIEIGPSQAQFFKTKWKSSLEEKLKLKLRLVTDLSAKPRFLIGNKYG